LREAALGEKEQLNLLIAGSSLMDPDCVGGRATGERCEGIVSAPDGSEMCPPAPFPYPCRPGHRWKNLPRRPSF
jgi:hypothetical protein